MQVGDRKKCLCYFGEFFNPKVLEGTVTYIHPERRFYIVRFDFARGRSFSEAFYFPSRAGNREAAPKAFKDNSSHIYREGYKPEKENKKRSFV